MRFLLIFFQLQSSFAQEAISDKMKWLAMAKPTSNLFVHFDKNVYSNNETVWLTGYLIKEAKVEISKHHVMAITLIRDIDSNLIIEDRFLMDKGLSFGSITLPDSLLTGNYHFLAYTDKLINGLPEVVFSQKITLKTNIDPAFKASMKVTSDHTSKDNPKVLLSVTSKDNRFLPKPLSVNYRYGSINKTAKTDASGQLLMNLTPQQNLSDPNLYVKLKYEKDSSFISMALPQAKGKAEVKFYPEGGNLIGGLLSNIGWEVKDQQKMPVALKAFLYENNEIIDTIETSSYGIGKFWLLPKKGSNYKVKLIHSNLVDSVYLLPKAIDNGLSVNIRNAVVKDTLRMYIRSNAVNKLTIIVHNFKQEFLNIPFELKNQLRVIAIPLVDVPKGLATVTILDSLSRPLAERMFFAHYTDVERFEIATDKKIYDQREKVSLKLKLKEDEKAIVSIAVVQDNRLELKKMNDIESYSYLNNELNNLPLSVKGSIFKDKGYLEQVLLVKGWRRYTWQDLEKIKLKDTVSRLDSLELRGIVTKLKKPITNAVTIGTLGGQKVVLVETNESGQFKLSTDDLITAAGKKTYVFVINAAKLPYFPKIEIDDSFTKTAKSLSKSANLQDPILPSTLVNNAELVLKGNEKAIRLNEVVIKSKNDNGFNYTRGANACGDYVCIYNILNCKNHVTDYGNKPPVPGNFYLENGIRTLYQACKVPDEQTFHQIKAIHLEKEFYINDYKDPQEPAFFSTIYWNYGIMLTNKNATDISFYTSDITGKFRIVIQGISSNDVVYADQFFEVKAKSN